MRNERNEFENWMIRHEEKSQNTAYQYKMSIDKVSQHYSQLNDQRLDLYQTTDISIIKDIAKEYGIGGKYSDFGDTGHGTIRNAIATYARFLEYKKLSNDSENEIMEGNIFELSGNDQNISKEINAIENNNFTYERDLKNSLIAQVEELFPNYKIFGTNREGIEYAIEGKRIDLLLENTNENTLLIIELKAGVADFHAFGQISMYLGLLSKKFIGKMITGVIIAGEIDASLVNACLITDKIKLLRYQMKLALEEIT
jgi:hypothetical protein